MVSNSVIFNAGLALVGGAVIGFLAVFFLKIISRLKWLLVIVAIAAIALFVTNQVAVAEVLLAKLQPTIDIAISGIGSASGQASKMLSKMTVEAFYAGFLGIFLGAAVLMGRKKKK